MSNHQCPQHSEFVASIRNDSIGDDIKAHMAGCPKCQEVAEVVRQLAPLRESADDAPPFADLYRRAQTRSILGKHSRRSTRASTPLRYFHRATGAALVAASLLLTVLPLILKPGPGGLLMIGPLLALLAATAGGILLTSESPGIAGRAATADVH